MVNFPAIIYFNGFVPTTILTVWKLLFIWIIGMNKQIKTTRGSREP